ncbi:hypothetical protein EDD85DRAFT_797034 [Armillaria nabsnona]|nr:hypothetical protein EDD85DRAFT_797034 [Armillaria nabsnona]
MIELLAFFEFCFRSCLGLDALVSNPCVVGYSFDAITVRLLGVFSLKDGGVLGQRVGLLDHRDDNDDSIGGYVLVNGSGMVWLQADEATSSARDGKGLLDVGCSHVYEWMWARGWKDGKRVAKSRDLVRGEVVVATVRYRPHVKASAALANEPYTDNIKCYRIRKDEDIVARHVQSSAEWTGCRKLSVSAVRRACVLTNSVFNKLVKNETLTKDDKSPVTDYAAQGVMSTMIHNAFPDDLIVGEEDATDLRLDSGADYRRRIVELANEAIVGPLGVGDVKQWGIGPGQALIPETLMNVIDRGNFQGGRTGRMWTIDPIDGTKGFLRGEQYAVCLFLIVDAQVQVGVIGCPNLPFDTDTKGSIFVAVRGQGAEQLNIESVEAAHTFHSTKDKISSILGITRPPIRMDSQAKYGCLARGDGGVYMHMPTGAGYKEKIWDHAPGAVLVEEAGGVITDSRGLPLDFGLGRTLGENFGVIAASKASHPKVLEAVQKVIVPEEKL